VRAAVSCLPTDLHSLRSWSDSGDRARSEISPPLPVSVSANQRPPPRHVTSAGCRRRELCAQRVATVLRATGRIASADTERITLAHAGYSLYCTTGREMPPKCPFPWGGANTWFFGPTQVRTPNSISIGSAVLAQLMAVTNKHRHTDHATSVAIGRTWGLKRALIHTHRKPQKQIYLRQ